MTKAEKRALKKLEGDDVVEEVIEEVTDEAVDEDEGVDLMKLHEEVMANLNKVSASMNEVTCKVNEVGAKVDGLEARVQKLEEAPQASAKAANGLGKFVVEFKEEYSVEDFGKYFAKGVYADLVKKLSPIDD